MQLLTILSVVTTDVLSALVVYSLFLQLPEDQMVLAMSIGTLPMVSLVGVLEQLVASMALEVSRPKSSPAPPFAGVTWLLPLDSLFLPQPHLVRY